jgi:hypothetical protein
LVSRYRSDWNYHWTVAESLSIVHVRADPSTLHENIMPKSICWSQTFKSVLNVREHAVN